MPARRDVVQEKFFVRNDFGDDIGPFFWGQFAFDDLDFSHIAQEIGVIQGDIAAVEAAEDITVRFDDAPVPGMGPAAAGADDVRDGSGRAVKV